MGSAATASVFSDRLALRIVYLINNSVQIVKRGIK